MKKEDIIEIVNKHRNKFFWNGSYTEDEQRYNLKILFKDGEHYRDYKTVASYNFDRFRNNINTGIIHYYNVIVKDMFGNLIFDRNKNLEKDNPIKTLNDFELYLTNIEKDVKKFYINKKLKSIGNDFK